MMLTPGHPNDAPSGPRPDTDDVSPHAQGAAGEAEAQAVSVPGAGVPCLLLIEDNPDTGYLMRESIEGHFGSGCVRQVGTLHQAREQDLAAIDLVLSDMNLPDGTGLDLLPELLARRADLPVVFVTAEHILDNAIKAIQRGAYDYIVKMGDYLFALPVVIEKNLMLHRIKQEHARLLAEVKQKNQQLEALVRQLETMASTDPLTGLANRRAFNEALAQRFAEAQRKGQDLALLLMDLDGFKPLNDTLGHQEGDRMLQLVSRVLRANCRASDVAGRFGGDEFVLLLSQASAEDAQHVAHRIAHEIDTSAADQLAALRYPGRLSASMGISALRLSLPATPEQMLGQSDHAMYVSKSKVSQSVTIYLRHTPTLPPVEDAGEDVQHRKAV